MHRETFIAKLTEIQQNARHLLSQLQASEHDKFAATFIGPEGNTAQIAITLEKAASKSRGV